MYFGAEYSAEDTACRVMYNWKDSGVTLCDSAVRVAPAPDPHQKVRKSARIVTRCKKVLKIP